MSKDPTEEALQELLEEVSQVAKQIAASDDRQWAPRLFELADEIAGWRNELQDRPAS
jgi:hypothetical protein